MPKIHVVALSLLLGGVTVAGAAAAMKTVRLGASVAATRTTSVPDAVVAARRRKLDTWSAQLQHAKAARPPALPAVPRYAPVEIPTVPAALEAAAAAPPPAPAPAAPQRVVAGPVQPAAPGAAPTPVVQTVPATTATAPQPAPTVSEDAGQGSWSESEDGGHGGDGGYGGDD